MTDIYSHTKKKDKQFLFETHLQWVTKKTGRLSARDCKESFHVAAHHSMGGEGKEWSPEHLLLGAASSCLMTTFLLFAGRLGLEISRYDCSCIGQVHLVEGHYQFTTIHLYPKIFIREEASREKARQALEKARQHCLVINSLRATILFHAEILLDESSPVPVREIK